MFGAPQTSGQQEGTAKLLAAVGCKPGPQCCAGNVITSISGTALFIIGCIAAAGAMPMTTAGWLTVGFGGTMLLGNLCVGGLKQRKCMVILGTLTAATFILLGSLGAAGIISMKALGVGVLVLAILNPIYCGFGGDMGCLIARNMTRVDASSDHHRDV